MYFCNRTDAHSLYHADIMQTKVLAWKDLKTSWHEFPWIISATKCPHHIIEGCPAKTQKTLLVDLAVPRNISPDLSNESCKVVNIDDLHHMLETKKAHFLQNISLAELALTSAVRRSLAIFRTKSCPLPLAVSC
jgi:glutamyl-tRNA reductase